MLETRIEKLGSKIAEEKLDAVLIFSDSNRFYLSGFHGSNGLLYINADYAMLFTDFRYTEQAKTQAPDYEVIQAGKDGLFISCIETLEGKLGKKLGFEKAHATLAQYEKMKDAFNGKAELVPVEQMVEKLRLVKSPGEIELIKKAQDISEKAFNEWLGKLKPEMTEAEAALELEIGMRRFGSGPVAFDIIVGAGPNAALPHHTPDDTPLGKGRTIVVDFGATYGWYNSDTTRTIFIGSAPDGMRDIYEIVLEAQLAALGALGKGKSGIEIDAAARDHINDSGHAEHFGHGLGHGIGIDVHEGPVLSPKSEDILEPFNVFSVEPGIYIPGVGGVRIEDLCWLKAEGGYENLTGLPKDLIIL